MTTFNELIKRRRTIRKFTEELLSPSEVELILKSGLMSPASKNRNSWEFIVVEDKEVLSKLAKSKSHGSNVLSQAAIAVVVTANPLVSDVWTEDASVATIIMQLQAEDLGIGSCWVQIRERETEHGISSEEYVKEILDIPLHIQVLSIVAFGKKNEIKTPFDEEKLQWEKIHIEKW
ncbi:MAG: nitroreductase family protein [Bacteroidales bacterium]|nr:nitroreductase family protein [Bacteroidales bacterium]